MQRFHLSKPLVLVALTMVLIAATSARAAVISNEVSPLAFTVTNPCNGEDVAFSGQQHVLFMAGNPDFGFHISFELTGYGSSGTRYTSHGFNTTVTVLNQPPQETSTMVQGVAFVSSGGEPTFVFRATFHTTFNANGEQTVVVSDVSTECRG